MRQHPTMQAMHPFVGWLALMAIAAYVALTIPTGNTTAVSQPMMPSAETATSGD